MAKKADTLWAPRPGDNPTEAPPPDPAAVPGPAAIAEVPPVHRPGSAMELIQSAIAAKLDPEALKAVTDWAKGLAAGEAERLYNADMVACQAFMPTIVNDAENEHTKSRFPKFETMLRAAKPVWVKHGFALSIVDATLNGELLHYVGEVMHSGGHTKKIVGDIALDGTGAKGGASAMNRPQATGSTRSYAMRYLVRDVFCLAFADEDDDAVNRARSAITEEQVKKLNETFAELRRHEWLKKKYLLWLEWLKIERPEDMKQGDFPKAMRELERQLDVLKNGGAP
jgi:hypothetical protein